MSQSRAPYNNRGAADRAAPVRTRPQACRRTRPGPHSRVRPAQGYDGQIGGRPPPSGRFSLLGLYKLCLRSCCGEQGTPRPREQGDAASEPVSVWAALPGPHFTPMQLSGLLPRRSCGSGLRVAASRRAAQQAEWAFLSGKERKPRKARAGRGARAKAGGQGSPPFVRLPGDALILMDDTDEDDPDRAGHVSENRSGRNREEGFPGTEVTRVQRRLHCSRIRAEGPGGQASCSPRTVPPVGWAPLTPRGAARAHAPTPRPTRRCMRMRTHRPPRSGPRRRPSRRFVLPLSGLVRPERDSRSNSLTFSV